MQFPMRIYGKEYIPKIARTRTRHSHTHTTRTRTRARARARTRTRAHAHAHAHEHAHAYIHGRYLPFQAVHAPLESTPSWQDQFNIDDFDGDVDRWTYAAMVAQVDQAVGSVVQALGDSGLYANSVTIVSTDNGGEPSNGGYNW